MMNFMVLRTIKNIILKKYTKKLEISQITKLIFMHPKVLNSQLIDYESKIDTTNSYVNE